VKVGLKREESEEVVNQVGGAQYWPKAERCKRRAINVAGCCKRVKKMRTEGKSYLFQWLRNGSIDLREDSFQEEGERGGGYWTVKSKWEWTYSALRTTLNQDDGDNGWDVKWERSVKCEIECEVLFTLRKTSAAQKWNGNNKASGLELKAFLLFGRKQTKEFRSWTHTRCQGLNIFCVR